MPKVQTITREHTKPLIEPYGLAEAVRAGDLLYIAGQTGLDEDHKVVAGGLKAQATQEGPPVLLCFIEGPPAFALSGVGKAARREKVIASLTRFCGAAAAAPLDYDDNDWTTEPWTYGYVGAMPPGVMTRFGHALRMP
jgi:monoamine oxidase